MQIKVGLGGGCLGLWMKTVLFLLKNFEAFL